MKTTPRVRALRKLQRARQEFIAIARRERAQGRQMPDGLGLAWWALEQAALKYGRAAERWAAARRRSP